MSETRTIHQENLRVPPGDNLRILLSDYEFVKATTDHQQAIVNDRRDKEAKKWQEITRLRNKQLKEAFVGKELVVSGDFITDDMHWHSADPRESPWWLIDYDFHGRPDYSEVDGQRVTVVDVREVDDGDLLEPTPFSDVYAVLLQDEEGNFRLGHFNMPEELGSYRGLSIVASDGS